MKMSWYETSSAFWIQNVETGEVRCMGDGVDMFTNAEDEILIPGSDEFYAALDALMDDSETYEAYFGE